MTRTEADRMEAVYTWLSAAQVARLYFHDGEHPDDPDAVAVSADTILRWHDDENHPLRGQDHAPKGAKRRMILFRPAHVEAYIEQEEAA